jgi:N-acetylglutamate synthase-like GNAT family acetyltransferase
MDIRPYQPRDRASCIGVFDSQVPELLNSAARPRFESHLDRAAGPFFVMEHEDTIVGCGGYAFLPDQSAAALRWGMVHRGFQKLGFGRFLLLYRIREIGRNGSVGVVFAHSPRPSVGFFEKQGFRVNRVENDAYAPGVDRVELIRKLTVCP